MLGVDGKTHRLVMARFPADTGVVAYERAQSLDIEFLERVFMKSAHAYKCVTYKGTSLDSGFWHGRAVDKQINGPRELSLYWINEFLDSELKTTPAAGSKRLAIAIRQAIKESSDSAIREQLLAATRLVPGHDGQRTTPATLAQQLGLTPAASDAIRESMPRPELFEEAMQVDAEEFGRHILYRAVELDNGALLVGENERFDAIFQREETRAVDGAVRFSTEGRVVDQKLRKVK
jgi:hypothetical protein